MNIKKQSRDEERRILTAMIVDKNVCGRIYAKWERDMFKSKWANIVSGWCMKYYKKYQKAPMKNIESLFENWERKTKDKNTVKLISSFIGSLSDEYEELAEENNSEYFIDLAGTYFNQVQIERLVETIDDDIDRGDAEKAHERLIKYNKVELGVGSHIDVFHDKDAIINAFDEEQKPILRLDGALQEFFMNALERECFISFLGKKGIGKSFWLMFMAYQGLLQRKRVAFFEVGDMSEKQTMRRFMVRNSRHPRKAQVVKIPIKIKKIKDKNKVKVKYKEKEFLKKLEWRQALKECNRLMRKKVKSKKSFFRLSCHFNSTLSVGGIHSILQQWDREGWVPDIICIDYADILKMDYPGIEGRDRINETWKQLRSLSQKQRCLLITATQADANSYSKKRMSMANFTDDRRKIDHVTGMIGINQTRQEKKQGVMRLNWIAARDDEFHTDVDVYVAGCLAIGNPAMVSTF